MPSTSTPTPKMTVAELQVALHAYIAASETSHANYKLTMEALYADQARQHTAMFATAALTNANQHQYIKQQALEHGQAIHYHEQRYMLLEAELAAEKADNFQRHTERSQTPATARVDTGIHMFADAGLPMHSISAFMDEDTDTGSLPLFSAHQADANANN